MFLYFMRKHAAYHDVQVLSYVVMDNHFHLLVEVPPKKKGAPVPMSDAVFLERLKAFASDIYYVDIKQMLERFRKGGRLSFGEALRCRVRYFTDGMAFGSRDFLNKVFKESRDHFSEKRTSGARPIRGVAWKEDADRLYLMRALKKEILK